jgi:2-polyprenyl-3-methyl-5-hydroxy-6-metoxy-1,4-benzoquinol methylase
MTKLDCCPVCSGELLAPKHGVWEVVECRDCGHSVSLYGLTFATSKTFINFFDTDDFLAARDRNAPMQIAGEQARLDYITSLGVLDHGASTLEIGCSTGESLHIAKKAGFDVSGHDYSEQATAYARERYGVNATSDFAALQSREYDAVFAFNVIEHVPDLTAFLGSITANLKPGGVLYLRMPHSHSLFARLFGENWPGYCPDHIQFFSRQSIRKFMAKSGFEIEKLRTMSIGYNVLGGIRRLMTRRSSLVATQGVGTSHAPSQRRRTIMHIFSKMYVPIAATEDVLFLGDEIVMVARKSVAAT